MPKLLDRPDCSCCYHNLMVLNLLARDKSVEYLYLIPTTITERLLISATPGLSVECTLELIPLRDESE